MQSVFQMETYVDAHAARGRQNSHHGDVGHDPWTLRSEGNSANQLASRSPAVHDLLARNEGVGEKLLIVMRGKGYGRRSSTQLCIRKADTDIDM